MTYIDATSKRTVDILNLTGGSQNTTTGLYTAAAATIQSDVVCDMQPVPKRAGNVFKTLGGDEVEADYLMFTATYLTGGIKLFYTVQDQADSKQYEIVALEDLRDHWEFFLSRIDKDGA